MEEITPTRNNVPSMTCTSLSAKKCLPFSFISFR
jgi:hypothetical protein